MNLMMKQFYTKLLNQISNCYDQDDDFSILDMGCGIGILSAIISQNFPSAKVTGFDISNEVVKSARLLSPSISFYVGNIYSLPHCKESFDMVICLEVLEHLDRPETIIDNIARLCKKYAIFSIPNNWKFRAVNVIRFKYLERKGSTPNHKNEWTKEEFSSLLSPYFKINDVSTVAGVWLQFLCEKLNSKE
jgi:2-polyprenyl-3-methyl-5-hydroxy-6-metoxy-1,4-benzoquinol methylase